eukprot:2062354-Amphidinium_carterae.1
MVRARELDLAQQADNDGVQSLEKGYRRELKEATEILKRHAVCRGPVLRFLHANKWTMTSPVMEIAKSKQTLGKERSARTRHEQAQAAQEEVADAAKIPSKYNQLTLMTFSILAERVLPAADPVALSFPNVIASFEKKAKAEEKKQECLRILQYATGFPVTLSLTGTLSTWQGFFKHLEQAVSVRGRLDKPLKLPVDWAKNGIYAVKEVTADDEVIVVQKLNKQTIVCPLSEFNLMPPSMSGLFIAQNWSEVDAEISWDGAMPGEGFAVGKKCGNHYMKKRKALNDESPASAKSSRRAAKTP